jgi:hypothetical protein
MMTVTLSQDMWNSILLLLAEHPYKVSAPLIQGITNQLREQMQEQELQNNVKPLRAPGE